jgi:O-acetyl-ADP-ribose deacetylase
MMNARIDLLREDITLLAVDAIVNAANSTLLGGGGVDGAIHRAAGSELLTECRLLNGCLTGEAKITKAYKLPSQFVIHAVGPIWKGGNFGEEELLARVYFNCLHLAANHKFNTIAFPNISTGIYGFPKSKACEIALKTTVNFLANNEFPRKIIFVCFDDENYRLYLQVLQR